MQDAYCLRCAPQVHGAVRDVLGFARQVHHHRAGRGGGQPGHRARRRGDDHRELPRRAARVRRRHAGHGAGRAGLASASAGWTGCSTRRSPAACRRSWPPRRAPTPASCSPSTPRPRWSARTRCSPTRPAWTPSRPRASRKTTCRWAGPRSASCARSWPTSAPAWRWRSAAPPRGSTCGRRCAEPSVPLRAVHDLVRRRCRGWTSTARWPPSSPPSTTLLPEICRVAAENSPVLPVGRLRSRK